MNIGLTPLHKAWEGMRARCLIASMPNYKYYGGRGIRICKRWNNYKNFAVDMGPHPGKGWTLDRKNNNGNYCKSNCRWATRATQTRNRDCVKLTMAAANAIRRRYAKGNISQAALAVEYGVAQSGISKIISRTTWK